MLCFPVTSFTLHLVVDGCAVLRRRLLNYSDSAMSVGTVGKKQCLGITVILFPYSFNLYAHKQVAGTRGSVVG
jgi:hypothetical protein